MSLPEAIFSFVVRAADSSKYTLILVTPPPDSPALKSLAVQFGDGDPNAGLRAARLRAMAETIRANGGAVVAESLAPFLDPPSSPGVSSYNVDESWVLPAVEELGGRPEVSDDGTIVYVFDELTVSAVASDANLILADPALASVGSMGASELAALASERNLATQGSDANALRDALRAWAGEQLGDETQGLFPEGYLEERPTPFSNAESGQLFAAGFLGLVNFGGAAYLGSLLSQIPPGMKLQGDLGLLQSGFPFLLAYAVAYLAIPSARFVSLQASNAQVEQRNAARRAWRDALERGGGELRKRMDAAGTRRKKLRLVDNDQVAYDSAKDLSEQKTEQRPDLDDFDRRLRDATDGK